MFWLTSKNERQFSTIFPPYIMRYPYFNPCTIHLLLHTARTWSLVNEWTSNLHTTSLDTISSLWVWKSAYTLCYTRVPLLNVQLQSLAWQESDLYQCIDSGAVAQLVHSQSGDFGRGAATETIAMPCRRCYMPSRYHTLLYPTLLYLSYPSL